MNSEEIIFVDNQNSQDLSQQETNITQKTEETQLLVTNQQSSNNQIETKEEDLPQDNKDNNNNDNNELNQSYEEKQPLKINLLYFIGVNSLVLNILASFDKTISIYSPIILTLTNIITYLSLYKQQEVKLLSYQSFQKSKQIYQKTKSQITQERVLISLSIILISSLFIINIYNSNQANHLQNILSRQQNIQNHLIQQIHNQKLELTHQGYNNQIIENRKQDLSTLYSQLNLMGDEVYRKVQQLINLTEQQQNEISQLRKEIYSRQVTSQSDQKMKQSDIEKLKQNIPSQNPQEQQQKQTTKQQQENLNNFRQPVKVTQKESRQQPKQQIKYIRPYHLSQRNTKSFESTQQKDQILGTSQNKSNESSSINNQQFTQNKQQQNTQQQWQTKQFSDSRLNFLNDQFKQLNQIISSS